MARHEYDTYTKSLVEAFIPQARAGIGYCGENLVDILNRRGDPTEINKVIDELNGCIDLLLAPTLKSGCTFSDLKAQRIMNRQNFKLESVLTRGQMSVIRDYPPITIT